MNQVNITGRLTRDPETRTTSDGTTVTNLRIAVEGRRPGGDADAFVNVAIFGKAADAANHKLTKGWLVLIEGRLRTNDWTGSDGQRHSDLEILARTIRFLTAPRATDIPDAITSDDETPE